MINERCIRLCIMVSFILLNGHNSQPTVELATNGVQFGDTPGAGRRFILGIQSF